MIIGEKIALGTSGILIKILVKLLCILKIFVLGCYN